MSFVDGTTPKRSWRERNGASVAGLEPVARLAGLAGLAGLERLGPVAGPAAVAAPGPLAGPASGDSGRPAGAEGGRVE